MHGTDSTKTQLNINNCIFCTGAGDERVGKISFPHIVIIKYAVRYGIIPRCAHPKAIYQKFNFLSRPPVMIVVAVDIVFVYAGPVLRPGTPPEFRCHGFILFFLE